MLKISENNGTEEIGLVTPTPVLQRFGVTYVSPNKLLNKQLSSRCFETPWGNVTPL